MVNVNHDLIPYQRHLFISVSLREDSQISFAGGNVFLNDWGGGVGGFYTRMFLKF